MGFVRSAYLSALPFLVNKLHLNVNYYKNNSLIADSVLVNTVLKVKNDSFVKQTLEELLNVYLLAQQTNKLQGDIAEVGVYRGGSAKLIAMNKGKRSLHLFDSFEGMKEVSKNDLHKVADFADTSLETVQKYLSEFNDVYFYKGWFPHTAGPIKDKQFSLVHVDADLYQSTLDSLIFFYPRMVKGAVFISHDYNSISCPGVIKAFTEFFTDKPELVIQIAGTSQGLFVKL